MEQVFISYSRRDLAFVKRLSADLQAAGLQVWYDLSGLEAGTRWGREIQNALRNSRYFVVVLSPNSVESEWVEREFIYASNQKLKIVPLLYRECELPLWSLNMHYLVLNEENYRDQFGNLLKLLGISPQPEKPVVEAVETPVITTGVKEEPPSLVSAAAPEEKIPALMVEIKEEPAAAVVPESRQVEKEQPAVPVIETPIPHPKTEEKTPLVVKKERPSLVWERKVKPAKVAEEKELKKPVKEKPALRVKEKEKTPPRPGAKKTWIPVLGGAAGIVLITLGIIFFGGDIKAALFPSPSSTTQPTTIPLTHTPTLTSTRTRTATPTPSIGSTRWRIVDSMMMVYVPEGDFPMGSDTGALDKRPAHTVFLDAFWIDKIEVTNAMYARCVQAGACQPPSDFSNGSGETYYGEWTKADYPVIYVDWNAAAVYCAWSGVRLPTEAEWEKAARGTDGRLYPWGDEPPTRNLGDWHTGGYGGEFSSPSGASPYGALDLAGSVWEWVSDWYDSTYYADSLLNNPTGPPSGIDRVVRGGTQLDLMTSVLSSTRYHQNPSDAESYLGFRCAMDASETVFAEEAALPTAVATSISPTDGMPMVQVPAGEFTRGNNAFADASPEQIVTLDAYWIDQTEVTVGMYLLCDQAGVCQDPGISGSFTRAVYYMNPEYHDYPLMYATWEMADTYCTWAGRRLPTEAEWEKAARGTDGRTYPWGEGLDCTLANYGDCVEDTTPVGSYPLGASPFGALDMAGNLWEWVADWYQPDYYGSLGLDSINPPGPLTGERGICRVLRGGSAGSQSEELMSAYRKKYCFTNAGVSNGFRCAMDASETIASEAETSPTVAVLPPTDSASPMDGMPMVQVPEGEFTMGSDEYKDSQPVHTVHLDEFWIDQTEVTNGMYKLCVSAGDCEAPVIPEEALHPDYFISSVYTDYPVTDVDWNDAQAYCQWAGRRLPTEAEWEKAARGTDGRRYPWGGTDFSCELAIYNPGSFSTGCGDVKGTHQVGSVPAGASPYGALDMVGNVAEWVADWYSASYYSESPAANPTGPTSGEDHVLRGSSFRNIKLYLTTFYRSWYGSGDDIGFRCASSTSP